MIMRMRLTIAGAAIAAAILATPMLPVGPAGAGTSPPGASACPVFPADNVWNADISHLPVDVAEQRVAGEHERGVHQPPPRLRFVRRPQRPLWHPLHGRHRCPSQGGGDLPVRERERPRSVPVRRRHADRRRPERQRRPPRDHGRRLQLHPLRVVQRPLSAGGSTAGSGAIWSLTSDALRPAGWTSADAAGLPIFPGLLRPDEVAAGSITHAIRFTAEHTDTSYIWPARHEAGQRADPSLPPMGARFRLKASFDISHFSPDTQVVLRDCSATG